MVDAGRELDLAADDRGRHCRLPRIGAEVLELVEEAEADAAVAQEAVERGEQDLAEAGRGGVVERAGEGEVAAQRGAEQGAGGGDGALDVA